MLIAYNDIIGTINYDAIHSVKKNRTLNFSFNSYLRNKVNLAIEYDKLWYFGRFKNIHTVKTTIKCFLKFVSSIFNNWLTVFNYNLNIHYNIIDLYTSNEPPCGLLYIITSYKF